MVQVVTMVTELAVTIIKVLELIMVMELEAVMAKGTILTLEAIMAQEAHTQVQVAHMAGMYLERIPVRVSELARLIQEVTTDG